MNGVIPHLAIDGAKKAIDFYAKAFGAEELGRIDAQDGKRLVHAHVKINGSDVMMSDVFPEFGMSTDKPNGVHVHLEVDDADKWWARAVAAGATVAMPLDNAPWGSRYGHLNDPFGHRWAISSPLKG